MYCWRDLGDSGKQELNQTLTIQVHVSEISEFGSIAASGNCHHRTCFRSVRPKAKSPARRASKQMSMIRCR
jgi:hypothetical protein